MNSSMQSSFYSPMEILDPAYFAGNLQMPQEQEQVCLKRSKSTDKTKKILPIDFVPTENSVICGNKRAFFNSVGNRRFRLLCQLHLAEYMNAPSKVEKSYVVTNVMRILKDTCPVGAFVAFENGRWWEVSERTSREKVGSFFRDCLSESYKSSSKNKIAKRKVKRTQSADTVNTCSSPVPSMTPLGHPVLPLSSDLLSALTELFSPVTATASTITPLSSPLDDDRSMGSSTGSFYDVDDLTYLSL